MPHTSGADILPEPTHLLIWRARATREEQDPCQTYRKVEILPSPIGEMAKGRKGSNEKKGRAKRPPTDNKAPITKFSLADEARDNENKGWKFPPRTKRSPIEDTKQTKSAVAKRQR